MNEYQNQIIRELLKKSSKILITNHIRPDGDCIGSALGFGLALINAGKQVEIVNRDGIPGSFKHLPGSDLVVKKVSSSYDLSIVLDCSDLERIGGVLGEEIPDINIDHHITNLFFAKHNFVEPESAATAELLAKSIPEWGLTIDEPIATCLLTGILSDTIGFRTSSVTPDTMVIASSLMSKGALLDDLYFRTLTQRSFEAVSLWGRGLSRLHLEGRLLWAELLLEDRKKVHYPGNDDADLINVLSGVQECDISLIFVEQKGGKVKVSWRAQPGWNVSKIALQFGGGGHPAAAGAEINGDIEEVKKMVLEATKKILLSGNSDHQLLEKVVIPPTEMGSE